MPSPIPHAITGLAAAILLKKRGGGHSTLFYSVAVGLSLLPDLDLVPVYLAGATSAIWHRTFTHSIIFCLIVSWLLSLLAPLSERFGRNRVFVLSATVLLFHLVLDYFCIDQNPPHGIMFLFPFSSGFYMAEAPFFGMGWVMDIVITTGLLLAATAGVWIASKWVQGDPFHVKESGLASKATNKGSLNVRGISEV